MKKKDDLQQMIKNKNIVYIATKNSDYIRINEEILMVKRLASSYKIICYSDKKYFSRILKVYKSILTTSFKDCDMVFVGFMAQMILPFLSWKWNKKDVLTDFFISIYDTIVDDRKKIKVNSLIALILKKIDMITIKKSNWIITDTVAHALYFCKELGAVKDNCYVNYLEADRDIYYPMQIEKPIMWKGKKIVLYFGSILPVQGIDVVMNTISELRYIKQIHFIIIGPVQNKVKTVDYDTVTYIPWLEQNVLANYIAFSDLCLAGHFSANVNKAKRTIPGKAYIYEAMNKPMVLGDTVANHELFEEDSKHIFVPVGSSKILADIIREFFQNHYD
ncbi:Uncharacterised protein [[Eubacterium] contortum]|uniref:Uncharacterized protein n=1 Tax=Faecalicatena contorta TaxID=39482 RepID=A0A174HU75_9FIRM|nr:glycosyltransferase [Faecalicatena contorta]CUO77156.1 Uncharacterised protein [[Eubacterium] contortum] [Faecalicatena contorta]